LLTKIDERLSIIDTMALGKQGVVAAYLLSGKERALVDMGYESSAGIVVSDLEENEVSLDSLDYLLPTHVHLDHCGSCGTLAEKFAGASIRVHPRGEPHLVDPGKLWGGARKIFGAEVVNRYGRPQPIHRSRMRVIGDGEEIVLGRGLTLRSIWTPGHASHHLSYVLEETDAVLTGDAVGITYPSFPVLTPTTPPTTFNLQLAIESLERIQALAPSKLLTPHYGVVANSDVIDKNIHALKEWEAKIRKMVGEGFTQDEIARGLIEETARRGGLSADVIPDYLSLSIRISALGFMRYLKD
jgi:glyoxylase-like metal-dependent hydrolase (beta-lactamase superfamily II)